MRKVLSLYVFIIFFLTSCVSSQTDGSKTTNENHKNSYKISSEYNFSNNGEVLNYFTTLNRLVEEGENYKVFSDQDLTGYRYEVYDYNGVCIDYGYYGWKGAEFEQNGDILRLRFLLGGNIGNEKYFDIKNGKVSRIFECVLATSSDLIAYFSVSETEGSKTSIKIENIFDPNVFNSEFLREISDTSILQHYNLKAEFIENNKKFKITYQKAENYNEVTEILDLE